MSPCCRHELRLYQFLSEHSLISLVAFVCVWPAMYLEMARILFPILFSQLWQNESGFIGRIV